MQSGKNINIYMNKLHPAQVQVWNQRKRFNILCCGRRWGKTFFWLFLVAQVVKRYLNARAAVGEKFVAEIGYFSPTYKNLQAAWRDFLVVFDPIITKRSEQDHTVEIFGKILIEFWSLDKPKVIRGRKYVLVVIDEAAFVENLRSVFSLIILPTLKDRKGDAWFMSSPNGFNDFEHLFRLGKNKIFPDWTCFQRKTVENPYIDPAEIELDRKLMLPDEFDQEYNAMFVSLGNMPFDIETFKQIPSKNFILDPDDILAQIRYWDLSAAAGGDYRGSVKNIITHDPHFFLSGFYREKGDWGKNYYKLKSKILSEPEVTHMFETEGMGLVCWQMIRDDSDLIGIKRYPADRRYTREDKGDRANLWALEAQNSRITIVQDRGYSEFITELKAFKGNDKDEDTWIDSVSGSFLTFIHKYGGYKKLMKAAKEELAQKRDKANAEMSSKKLNLMRYLQDVM